MASCQCNTCKLDLIISTTGVLLTTITNLRQEMRTMSEATDRINAAIVGIQGDLDGLKAAAVVAAAAAAALQAALDAALADQGPVIAAAVAAAVAEQQAAAEAANAELAARLEAIDAQTPPVV